MKPKQFCSPGLAKILLQLGFVTKAEMSDLERGYAKRKVVAALSESGRGVEDVVIAAIASELNIERVDLKNGKRMDAVRKSGLANQLEANFMYGYRCLPLERSGNKVIVAVVDPLDLDAIAQLEFALGAKVEIKLAKETELIQTIDRVLGLQNAENLELESSGESQRTDELELATGAGAMSEEAGSATAPVITFVNQILADGQSAHASDIHLEPSMSSYEVRYRIDGIMTPQLTIPKRLQSYVTARLKILAGMDITEKRRPQDGRFRIRGVKGSAMDIRASTVPTQFGEKVVLRLLRSDISELSLAGLAMRSEDLQTFRDVLKTRDRIVLVCGPTGCGKTTTLYSALNDLKQGQTNIITVEDPVEIRLDGITQIQVDAKIGMTFASGLRSILRQDPDIILVGEIRDLETAEIAFQAAQTGHFVLSTLHTNSAVSAVTRLEDLGLPPFVVSGSLGAVLSQRLLRKVCSACTVPDQSEASVKSARRFGVDPALLIKGKGCEQCDQLGYRGRIGAYSLLVVTADVRDLIRAGAPEAKIQEAARANGMKDLFESGLDLVRRGLTTLDEVERVIGLSEFVDTKKSDASKPAAPVFHPVAAAPSTALEQADKGSDLEAIKRSEKGSIEALAEKYREEVAAGNGPNRKKVLLVDDDDGVRAVVSRILRKSDFEVCEAANGFEALDKLAEFLPDIVVCDLVMPGMCGKELVSELRRNEKTEKLKVLMLTGSDDEENEIELISLGANDFVSKASSPVLVIARVRRLLELG